MARWNHAASIEQDLRPPQIQASDERHMQFMPVQPAGDGKADVTASNPAGTAVTGASSAPTSKTLGIFDIQGGRQHRKGRISAGRKTKRIWYHNLQRKGKSFTTLLSCHAIYLLASPIAPFP
jgi:hypothetical protein